jgi:hypothetical protein
MPLQPLFLRLKAYQHNKDDDEADDGFDNAAAAAAVAASGSGDVEDDGRILLHYACMQGHSSRTPALQMLTDAPTAGDVDALKELLSAGVDPNPSPAPRTPQVDGSMVGLSTKAIKRKR